MNLSSSYSSRDTSFSLPENKEVSMVPFSVSYLYPFFTFSFKLFQGKVCIYRWSPSLACCSNLHILFLGNSDISQSTHRRLPCNPVFRDRREGDGQFRRAQQEKCQDKSWEEEEAPYHRPSSSLGYATKAFPSH